MASHLCKLCQKRPATVHLTEIVQGEKRELHYCETCAQKEGVSPLTPQSLFAHLVGPSSEPEGENLVCPECNLGYTEFRQRGRLGCGNCYQLFREGLAPLLEKIHGSTQHLGKLPVKAGTQHEAEREIIQLKRDLARVIQREEYERAAEIRDRIRKLEEAEGRESD